MISRRLGRGEEFWTAGDSRVTLDGWDSRVTLCRNGYEMTESSRGCRQRSALLVVISCFLFATCATSGCSPSRVDPTTSSEQVGGSNGVADADGELTIKPVHPSGLTSDATRFTLLDAQQTGMDHTQPLDLNHPMKDLYHSGFVCGGVAIGDVNGDDRPDVFVASGPRANRLFLQVGDWKYRDDAEAAGVAAVDRWATGAAMADVDGDGDLDLYVCNYEAPNQLFINDGHGKFRDEAEAWGVANSDASLMSTFCDYDRDGDLDMFLLTYRLYRPGGRPTRPPVSIKGNKVEVLPEYAKYYRIIQRSATAFEMDCTGRPDRLFRNDGQGHFEDVTSEAGINSVGFGLSAIWWDYNMDGWPDLFVGNDFDDPDHWFRNDGDGRFTDVLPTAVPCTSWFSMGADFGDINDDGQFDMLVGDMSGRSRYRRQTSMGVRTAAKMATVAGPPPQLMRNALYVSSGRAERYFEAAELADLAATNWTWSIKFADLDNDTRNDIFVTNGMIRNFSDNDIEFGPNVLIGHSEWELYERTPTRHEANLAFRNTGEMSFQEVGQAWGLDDVGASFAAAHADLDRDGDLDMIVANVDAPIRVYRNDTPNHNSLLIRLVGSSSNRWGIGAIARLRTESGEQVRMLSPQTGFCTSNEPYIHFGMGDSKRASLTIEWPSGAVQHFEDLAAGSLLTIREPLDTTPSTGTKNPPAAAGIATLEGSPRAVMTPINVENAGILESDFDDFSRQPLLPWRMSQWGPGIAVGDVDGNGSEDVFIGGPAGQAARLYLVDDEGTWHVKTNPAFEADKLHEDMGAVLFDLDADGDLDLYVSSGGVECSEESPLLQDRVYLNDGKGNFGRDDQRNVELRKSSSCVTAADYDRDGDVDLFVGVRTTPGRYPLSDGGVLLENRDGHLHDVGSVRAPQLSELGMITGAVWSDADNDGWLDLLVTTEWGPVHLLRNDSGMLTLQTDRAGLSELTGWWTGIVAADLDLDGDMDYVVGNMGDNSAYHPSREAPAILFYGVVEKDREAVLIEAESDNGTLYPSRGLMALESAIPSLRSKYGTHGQFARSPLSEVIAPAKVDDLRRFEVHESSTGVLWNDGERGFAFAPLPWMAQLAPVFGIAVTDWNGDGIADLIVTQNFHGIRPETGPLMSGEGCVMLGTKGRGWKQLAPTDRGWSISGECRGIATRYDKPGSAPSWIVVRKNTAPVVLSSAGNKDEGQTQALTVELQGDAGNRTAVGSRVQVKGVEGTIQVAEVAAGAGYLSQSSPKLQFTMPTAERSSGETVDRTVDIEVRWPDGATTQYPGQTGPHILLTK
ncbi:MAG: VCBS repeat-containing protein [Planctomycetales bacterium]|nr:VCBS repeat-containing protein [Planctomycetales bacterium]